MEILQRNYISEEELTRIISDKDERNIIKEFAVIKKIFPPEGEAYSFQHNNFQEYWAAESISDLELDKLLEYISFVGDASKLLNFMNRYFDFRLLGVIKLNAVVYDLMMRCAPKIRVFKRIKPSWLNTVAFICQMRQNNDLLDFILEREAELALDFEIERIEEKEREKIFRRVFEKYTERKIWLDRHKIDCEKLANFARTNNIYDFLLQHAKSKEHFIYRYNAIEILQYFRDYADEGLKNLLIQRAKDENENINVRYLCSHALSRLGFDGKDVIDQIVKLKNSNESLILSGLYYLIKGSSIVDEYVDILLSGINQGKYRSDLMDVGLNLAEGLKNVKTPSALKKVFEYFKDNPECLSDFLVKRSLEDIIRNGVSAFEGDESVYKSVKNLVVAVDKRHLEEPMSVLKLFFCQTKTIDRLLEELYSELAFENHYSIFASLANENFVGFLVREYKNEKLSEDNIWIFLNLLATSNSEGYKELRKMIEDETGHFHPRPAIDYEEQKKTKLRRKIEIIFDRDEFIKEAEKIYKGEEKSKIGKDDLDFQILLDENFQCKYNEFVSNTLRTVLKNDGDKYSFEELKSKIEEWDYEYFIIGNIYDLLYYGINVELNSKQIGFIRNFCMKNVNKVDFRTAYTQKGKEFSANWLAIWLWYFFRKCRFDYPEDILLDMLSFDWMESNGYVGVGYLEEHLDRQKIERRILDNLKDRIDAEPILKSHILLCKKYNLSSSFPYLKKVVSNDAIEIDTRILALGTVSGFPRAKDFLHKLLNTNNQEIFVETSEILLESNDEKTISVLKQHIKKDTQFALISAELLIKKQELSAIRYYCNHIKKTKTYKPNHLKKCPLCDVNTIKALSILLDLLKFYYSNNIQEERFNRLNTTIIEILKKIAIQNVKNFKRTVKSLKKFVKKNRKLKDVNFLNIYIDEIEKSFFIEYKKPLSITEAIKLANAAGF